MGAVEETERRQRIVDALIPSIAPFSEGIILGGSMGYGRNVSVNKASDVDLEVLLPADALGDVAGALKVALPYAVLAAYSRRELDCVQAIVLRDGVTVNVQLHELNRHADFSALRSSVNIARWVMGEGRPVIHPDFEGISHIIERTTSPRYGGCAYHWPFLNEQGTWYTGPMRQDFFDGSQFLHQKDGYLDKLQAEVWQAMMKRLVLEHGRDVDLAKANIVNTHWTYHHQRHRFPPARVEEIHAKTKVELAKYLANAPSIPL